jgi:hypothetical protein
MFAHVSDCVFIYIGDVTAAFPSKKMEIDSAFASRRKTHGRNAVGIGGREEPPLAVASMLREGL